MLLHQHLRPWLEARRELWIPSWKSSKGQLRRQTWLFLSAIDRLLNDGHITCLSSSETKRIVTCATKLKPTAQASLSPPLPQPPNAVVPATTNPARMMTPTRPTSTSILCPPASTSRALATTSAALAPSPPSRSFGPERTPPPAAPLCSAEAAAPAPPNQDSAALSP